MLYNPIPEWKPGIIRLGILKALRRLRNPYRNGSGSFVTRKSLNKLKEILPFRKETGRGLVSEHSNQSQGVSKGPPLVAIRYKD